MSLKEPDSEKGYLNDLEKWGCKFIDNGDNTWSVQSSEGGITRLEAETMYDAAWEAWHLMKPE